MSVSKLRLRHPKGVSTLELDLSSASVQDLQSQIQKLSEILPSQQDCEFEFGASCQCFLTMVLAQ